MRVNRVYIFDRSKRCLPAGLPNNNPVASPGINKYHAAVPSPKSNRGRTDGRGANKTSTHDARSITPARLSSLSPLSSISVWQKHSCPSVYSVHTARDQGLSNISSFRAESEAAQHCRGELGADCRSDVPANAKHSIYVLTHFQNGLPPLFARQVAIFPLP